jgi:hypothetical protein
MTTDYTSLFGDKSRFVLGESTESVRLEDGLLPVLGRDILVLCNQL